MNLMMKKLIRCAVLVASAVLGIGSLSAETVAWYHFNEGANATLMRGGQPSVLNAVDPTSLPGTPYSINNSCVLDPANFMPRYTNDMPSCVSWYDPATGARGTDNRCAWIRTNNNNGSRQGSIILIDDDEKLHCEHITVEFFVKATATSFSSSWNHAVVMRNSSGNTKAWGFVLNSDGRVIVIFNDPVNPENDPNYGTSYSGCVYAPSSAPNPPHVADGKWHHVAMTYDGTTIRVYVDYVLKASKTWAGPIVYGSGDTSKLCFGGADKATYGNWPGFIDEVRISDEALTPDKFLRVGGSGENAVKVTDQDTALYLPFDSAEICEDKFFGSTNTPIVLNAACSTNAYNIKVVGVYRADPCLLPSLETSDIVSNTFHSGIFAAESATNNGCWKFGQNTGAAGKSIHIAVDDFQNNNNTHLVTSGDFTMEFWLNLPSPPSVTDNLVVEQSGSKNGATLTLWASSSYLYYRLVSQESFEAYENGTGSFAYSDAYVPASQAFDGKWHHVALVVDRTHKIATAYFDGKLVKSFKKFVLASGVSTSATGKWLQLSGGWGSNRNDEWHNMSIDEFRITRRALAPQEFLMTGTALDAAAREALNTAATREWIAFEGDLSIEPRDAAVPDGSSTATTVGMTYSSDVPGVKGGRVVDGNGNVIRGANASSLYFSGAYGSGDASADTASQRLFFERNILLEEDMKSMTLEFFMKGTPGQAKAWATIVRGYGNANGADTDGERLWGVGYHQTSGSLYVLMDNNGSSQPLYYPDDTVSFADGRWHHVAVTYEPDGNGNTLCKFYRDYVQLGATKTFTGELECGDHGTSSFAIGSRYNGYIDEVRISKGVLTVDQMLHVHQGGTVIVVR